MKIAHCAACNRERPIRARGLCASCYQLAHRYHDLDRYADAVPRGRKGPPAKLTPEAVRDIYTSPDKAIYMAALYGVTTSTVSMIRQRKGRYRALTEGLTLGRPHTRAARRRAALPASAPTPDT